MTKISDQLLQQIRESQDVAAWYRLLSKVQIHGLHQLTNAIRDDHEQSSTYRVRKCLNSLGIVEPIVGNKSLKKLIDWCRGSDLAFLYFLLIGHYKQNHKSNVYSYNEQVLMSCIMELDLEVTLHAMDQILPPGHLSHRDQARLSKKSVQLEKKCDSSKKYNNVSPYFWKHPRPKPFVKSRPGNSIPADVVVSFPFWPAGEAATYKVNEKRWFASYKLQPAKRIAQGMVREIINDFCSAYEGENEINLCKSHQAALEVKRLWKDELIVKAFQHCIELLEGRENKFRRERIIGQLDKDVENYAQRLRKFSCIQYTKVATLKDGCKLCEYEKQMTTPAQDGNIKFLSGKNDIGHLKVAATSAVHKITSTNAFNSCKSVKVSDSEEKIPKSPPHLHRKLKKSSSKRKCSAMALNTAFIRKRNRAKRNFFIAPQMHQPYVFNYHRTFHNSDAPTDLVKIIRREAVRALTTEQEDSSLVDSSKNCVTPCPCGCASSQFELNRDYVTKAIVDCADSIWRTSVTNYESDRLAMNQTEVHQNHLRNYGGKEHPRHYLEYNQTYFDPDDSQLMDRMLIDAINMLRTDPNFVFATFPDAHKTIVMREWIKRRYGKTYNSNEILATQKNSDKIFQTILLIQNREPPTVNLHPFIVGGLTYADEAKILKLANELKFEYHQELNDRLMQNTALCWTAMGGEFRKGGYLRDIFYSYLPARNTEINRTHPWKADSKSVKRTKRNSS